MAAAAVPVGVVVAVGAEFDEEVPVGPCRGAVDCPLISACSAEVKDPDMPVNLFFNVQPYITLIIDM